MRAPSGPRSPEGPAGRPDPGHQSAGRPLAHGDRTPIWFAAQSGLTQLSVGQPRVAQSAVAQP